MGFDISPLTEGLATNFTFVRLLACMEEDVSFEIMQVTERLSADFTFVGVLACMQKHTGVGTTNAIRGRGSEKFIHSSRCAALE